MCKAYIPWLAYPEPNPVLIISEVSDQSLLCIFLNRTGRELGTPNNQSYAVAGLWNRTTSSVLLLFNQIPFVVRTGFEPVYMGELPIGIIAAY